MQHSLYHYIFVSFRSKLFLSQPYKINSFSLTTASMSSNKILELEEKVKTFLMTSTSRYCQSVQTVCTLFARFVKNGILREGVLLVLIHTENFGMGDLRITSKQIVIRMIVWQNPILMKSTRSVLKMAKLLKWGLNRLYFLLLLMIHHLSK